MNRTEQLRAEADGQLRRGDDAHALASYVALVEASGDDAARDYVRHAVGKMAEAARRIAGRLAAPDADEVLAAAAGHADRPDSPADLKRRVEQYFLAGRYAEACELAIERTRCTPQDAEAWNDLGAVHFAMGRPADSVQCFLRALDIDERRADARGNLKMACDAQGLAWRDVLARQRGPAAQPDAAPRVEAPPCGATPRAVPAAAAAPVFGALIVCTSADATLMEHTREAHPRSRVVFWDADAARAVGDAAAMAECVVAEDAVLADVTTAVVGEVVPLSRFDASLAAGLATAAAGRADRPDAGSVLFCPTNDTHTRMFEPISRHLPGSRFLLFDQRPEERCEDALRSLGLDYTAGDVRTLARLRPSAIVLGCDWNIAGRALVDAARERGVPSVILQEGCLDFDSKPRMQYCDFAFVQGPVMLRHLPQRMYFMTGNPRFDALRRLPLPEKPTVLINSNFTYGVHEDQRDAWVGAVVEACRALGVEFFISRHPRDTGEFPGLPVRPSGAGKIHGHIADSTVVVTRFSTIIYEAMFMGRRAVYYNPFGEKMHLFNEDYTGGLYKAHDPDGLARVLARAVAPTLSKQQRAAARFLDLHCGPREGGAARRCATALMSIVGVPVAAAL